MAREHGMTVLIRLKGFQHCNPTDIDSISAAAENNAAGIEAIREVGEKWGFEITHEGEQEMTTRQAPKRGAANRTEAPKPQTKASDDENPLEPV